jgi:hypothetical protein
MAGAFSCPEAAVVDHAQQPKVDLPDSIYDLIAAVLIEAAERLDRKEVAMNNAPSTLKKATGGERS